MTRAQWRCLECGATYDSARAAEACCDDYYPAHGRRHRRY